jgi:hypothetical protein
MSISYNKIKKKPTTFNSLFGVSVSQFEEILLKTTPAWKKGFCPNTNALADLMIIL